MIKGELEAAAFSDTPVPHVASQAAACRNLIGNAYHLANGGWRTGSVKG